MRRVYETKKVVGKTINPKLLSDNFFKSTLDFSLDTIKGREFFDALLISESYWKEFEAGEIAH